MYIYIIIILNLAANDPSWRRLLLVALSLSATSSRLSYCGARGVVVDVVAARASRGSAPCL